MFLIVFKATLSFLVFAFALNDLEDALILTDIGAQQSAELVSLMAKQKPQSQEEAKI